jgi:Replication initiator protein, pSAM2
MRSTVEAGGASPHNARRSAPLACGPARCPGVLAGSKDANRCIGYLTKYLTEQVADCHQANTDLHRTHAGRLAEALRYQPCSPRCANWLRYGIQPKGARLGVNARGQVLGHLGNKGLTCGFGGALGGTRTPTF